ncbi:MAG: TrkA family potassium uptake protein [Dehalococcoidia bacterium]|nr:TrkA family potassium uptake protein [Dehalococcoidia bacterium]
MYIIVVGGGAVGSGLARELIASPDHEVVLIEESGARANELRAELGEMVVHGDGTEVVVLGAAGAGRADLLIAVTADDGRNLVACEVGKHWFHIARTIARVDDQRNEGLFRMLGIDATVSAAAAVLAQLETSLPEHTVVPLMRLQGSGLEVVDLHVQEGSDAAGKAIRDLQLPRQTVISLVIGLDGAPRIPSGDTVLQNGDELIAVIAQGAESELRRLFATPLAPESDAVERGG